MSDQTADELRALRAEIKTFNNHRFVRVQNSWWRMMLQAFARGLAVGLGTVIGASVLVSALVYLLSQIDFIPLIGDWAAEIATEITQSVEGDIANGDSADPPAQ